MPRAQICDREGPPDPPRPLQASGAQLPSKLRLPGSLETEARQRMAPLQAYMSRLVQNQTLLRSEPLYYFLAAHRAPPRRRLWEQLTMGGGGGRAIGGSY